MQADRGKSSYRYGCWVGLVLVVLASGGRLGVARCLAEEPALRRTEADTFRAEREARLAAGAQVPVVEVGGGQSAGAGTGPVCDGATWLESNQNMDGSWGASFPLIVTGTAIEALTAVRPASPSEDTGAAWLSGQTAPNYEFLARQILALDGVPGYESTVAALNAQLIAAKNLPTTNMTFPNWPEGGWGISAGFESDCFTTALALHAIDAAGLNGGFKVINRAIGAGATNTHSWTIATGATKARIVITVTTATVRLRMKQGTPPTGADPFFSLPPGSWLITFPDNGLPFTAGLNFITVQSTALAGSYTMTASYETPTFDTRDLEEATEYLRQSQNVDGGWGLQRGQATEFYTTLHVILSLQRYTAYEFATDLTDATNYVRSLQLMDGSFGFGGPGIAYVTALAALGLVRSETPPFSMDTQDAITALIGMQQMDGSWDSEAYDTALAVRAIGEYDRNPTANAGSDQNVLDSDGDCFATVTLNGTASTDPDGALQSYSWTENGMVIATGNSPMVTLTVGTHTIVLTVTDVNCQTAIDTVVITITTTGVPNNVCHCCLAGPSCADIEPVLCQSLSGTPTPGACTVEPCCLPSGACLETDQACCAQAGGTPFVGQACTLPSACCLPNDTCIDLDPLCCTSQGGAPQSLGELCTASEACCLGDGSCEVLDPVCCSDMGGTPGGPGSMCAAPEACCLPNDTCAARAPVCCALQGGSSQGMGSTCGPVQGCCLPGGSCEDVDVLCCADMGGMSLGVGNLCEGDADGDGTDGDCGDACAADPNKLAPGICGCGVSDVDSDGDGTPNCNDLCPMDPNKIAPGICGCGVSDVDTDGDLTPDCNDLCPMDPLKIAPGQCGCGVPDTDTDGDMTADCNDLCPMDPLKVAPGQCGCGIADTDTDGDMTADCNDLCPMDPLKIAPGQCGCGAADTDTDGDTVADCIDNCPNNANPGQEDTDMDGIGDACEGIPCVVGVAGDAFCKMQESAMNAACTCNRCVAGFCQATPIEFGNVNCMGPANSANLDDILCVLGGFSNFNNCPNGDLHPLCTGNNIINLDDILLVLGAFSGSDPCGCVP